MVIFFRIAVFLACTLLYGCQQLQEENTAKENARQNRKEASSLNTRLGLAYLKQGDVPRAKQKLLSALDYAPDSAESNGAMAFFLEKTADFNQAKKYYLKALSLARGSGEQLNNYGAFLCRRGQYAQAESYFLKAINDVHYINSAAAYENAGLCAEAIPDLTKAVSYFSKALASDPGRRQSLYKLVSIELEQDNIHQALENLSKHLALVNEDQTLLELAVQTAKKANKTNLASQYQLRLNNLTDYTGVNNEYDNING